MFSVRGFVTFCLTFVAGLFWLIPSGLISNERWGCPLGPLAIAVVVALAVTCAEILARLTSKKSFPDEEGLRLRWLDLAHNIAEGERRRGSPTSTEVTSGPR